LAAIRRAEERAAGARALTAADVRAAFKSNVARVAQEARAAGGGGEGQNATRITAERVAAEAAIRRRAAETAAASAASATRATATADAAEAAARRRRQEIAAAVAAASAAAARAVEAEAAAAAAARRRAEERAAADAAAVARAAAEAAAAAAAAAARAAAEGAALARVDAHRVAMRAAAAAQVELTRAAREQAAAASAADALHASALAAALDRAAAERVEAEQHLLAMRQAELVASVGSAAAARASRDSDAAEKAAAKAANEAVAALTQAQHERTGVPVTLANAEVGMRVVPGVDFGYNREEANRAVLRTMLASGGVVTSIEGASRDGIVKVVWDAWSRTPATELRYAIGGVGGGDNFQYELYLAPPPLATHVMLTDGKYMCGANVQLPPSPSPAAVALRRMAVLRAIIGAGEPQLAVCRLTRDHILEAAMKGLKTPVRAVAWQLTAG